MSTKEIVPMNDLTRATTALRSDIDESIARVLDSGWFVLGPENQALESELSAYLGGVETVLVGNGTDALQLALSALEVGPGDSVMTVANAGGYASTAIRSLGAKALYADVERDSLLLSLDMFNAAIANVDEMPKALVVTHLFGSAVDVAPIVQRAAALGIAVVEDCAQALGASRGDKLVGTFGAISTTSFYPTKNLGALGDAGAVFTADPILATRVRQLRQYGWVSKYHVAVDGGINSRLDELQAAMLRTKLGYLDEWNSARREIHREYELAAGANVRFVTRAVDGFIGHLAVIDVADRAQALTVFDAAGVRTDVHYPVPDHLQLISPNGPVAQLAVTESAAERILSVPLFPELRRDEIERVCSALASI